MAKDRILDRFLDQAPACVMVRATLERMFAPQKLDELFQIHAQQQYERELLFSTVVDLMSLTVCGVHPSVHAAYQHRQESITVSVKSLYNKLNAMETQVSQSLVRHSAEVATQLVDKLGARDPWLSGYRIKVIDGNHLTGTDHRLGVLRDEGGAALPGLAVAVLDPQRGIFEDVVLAADAYVQETQLLAPIVQRLEPRDVIIADRLYCLSSLLFDTEFKDAFFIIRQHAGHLRWERKGRKQHCGCGETGDVYEQMVELTHPQTEEVLCARRISLKLKAATRNGDQELHILTNLPRDAATALEVAELYGRRWSVEAAFQDLTTNLKCELDSLGHPSAALFTFCVAAACYNAFAVIEAALREVHGADHVDENVSKFYLTEEINSTWRGLMIALPPEDWTGYQDRTLPQLARQLKNWARQMRLSRYQKHRRGAKRRRQRTYSPTKHVSTARLLKARIPRAKTEH